jgi:hypothetical protein
MSILAFPLVFNSDLIFVLGSNVELRSAKSIDRLDMRLLEVAFPLGLVRVCWIGS